MDRATEQKIVLVTQKTRLEGLVKRYNTKEQAQFYIEHHGGNFDDYILEHKIYYQSVEETKSFLQSYGRLHILDRENMPNYLFGKMDLVVVIGRDGLVANTLKYLDNQSVIGVNPDPQRWDGVLLPFSSKDLSKIVPETVSKKRKVENITIAEAKTNNGQCLLGVNDLFIGQRTHTSARYIIEVDGLEEVQSSSGIIVSTGLGSTGWLKSILAGADGIEAYCGGKGKTGLPDTFKWNSSFLYYTVREPYPSTSTSAGLVFGKIDEQSRMTIISQMPENGVIFSDGVEQDFIEFNSGTSVAIGIANKKGNLVI